MADDQTKGLFDGLINAVTTRDEKAALEAAKKELEDARAQADQELAKRQEAEARASQAEAGLAGARAQLDQETAARQRAQAQVTELQAELASVKQQLEQAKVRTYVVQSGDSLSKIAQQFYGDAKRWPEIFEANKDKIKDPNVIHPGQELRIP